MGDRDVRPRVESLEGRRVPACSGQVISPFIVFVAQNFPPATYAQVVHLPQVKAGGRDYGQASADFARTDFCD